MTHQYFQNVEELKTAFLAGTVNADEQTEWGTIEEQFGLWVLDTAGESVIVFHPGRKSVWARIESRLLEQGAQQVTKLGKLQYQRAHALASKHGHEWAAHFNVEDPQPTVELIRHTVYSYWENSTLPGWMKSGEVCPITNEHGAVVHTTGTGRTTWTVGTDGEVELTVSRPEGDVFQIRVSENTEIDGDRELEKFEAGHWFQSHYNQWKGYGWKIGFDLYVFINPDGTEICRRHVGAAHSALKAFLEADVVQKLLAPLWEIAEKNDPTPPEEFEETTE